MKLFKLNNIRKRSVTLLFFFSFIPLIFLGISTYYMFSRIIVNEINISTVKSLENLSNTVDSILVDSSKLLISLCNDKALASYISLENSEPEHVHEKEKKINEILQKTVYQLDFCTTVFLIDKQRMMYRYMKLDGYSDREICKRITSDNWYSEIWENDINVNIIGTRANYVYPSRKTLYFYKNILSMGDYMGTVVLGIDEYIFTRLLANAAGSELGTLFIVGPDNEVIVSEESGMNNDKLFTVDAIKDVRKLSDGFHHLDIAGESYLLSCRKLYSRPWQIILLMPNKNIYIKLILVKQSIAFFSIISIILIFLFIVIEDRTITLPIIKISKLMEKVQNGNLQIQFDEKSYGELEILRNGFNKMVSDFRKLLLKTRKDEEVKRLLKFRALQAQMNPHLIFNSLNVIRWMAELQSADNVAKAIVALARIVKYNMNSNTYISIAEEFKYLKDYIYIQNLHSLGSFEIYYDLDDRVFKYSIMKLLLQPFVENAITHGFKNITDIGVIEISGKIVKNKIIFTISDNGVGIGEAKLKEIFSSSTNSIKEERTGHIGIKNIIERISLFYGNKYGIRISKNNKQGTFIVLTIPANIYRDEGGGYDKGVDT